VTPALVDVTPAVPTANLPRDSHPTTGGNPWLAVVGALMLAGFVVLRRTAHAAR
jgi:LPXTG-motif cell wall-anchored protein